MKTILLAGALLLAAEIATPALAQKPPNTSGRQDLREWGNPSSADDPPSRIYIFWRTVACGLGKDVQRFAIWQPYDPETKKALDFYRITPKLPAVPLKGKLKLVDDDLFLNGEKCEDWPGQGG